MVVPPQDRGIGPQFGASPGAAGGSPSRIRMRLSGAGQPLYSRDRARSASDAPHPPAADRRRARGRLRLAAAGAPRARPPAAAHLARPIHQHAVRLARTRHVPDGDAPGEAGREEQELQHEVSLLAVLPVPLRGDAGGVERVIGHNPSHFQDCGSRCPVENVNLFEVRSSCAAERSSPAGLPAADRGRMGIRVPVRRGAAVWPRATLSAQDANINGELSL